MKVLIYAYESRYGGLHGMNEGAVVEVKSTEEIDGYGVEMSEEVIDSYGLEEDEEEYCIEEERCWEVYKIKDGITLSTEELSNIWSTEGHEIFVEEYCDATDVYEVLGGK